MTSKDKLEVVLEDDADADVDNEDGDADEDNDVPEDEVVAVVKERERGSISISEGLGKRKVSVESNFRRMSTLSQSNGGYSSHPIRRGRRRAVTTQDHKMCALVQTRLKLGDIM
ncbi:unnamed protein product [Allacma fusca]|uniref:Uncharacterized protein n=1 Tax=Allacma fusca TaxID=39272 RepID=A0A8J2KS89_9HEXA|nr:unnamed protein product [Allacma fusca]